MSMHCERHVECILKRCTVKLVKQQGLLMPIHEHDPQCDLDLTCMVELSVNLDVDLKHKLDLKVILAREVCPEFVSPP